MSIRCFLGFHADNYEYVATDSCVKESRCSRCNRVDQKTTHTWGDWVYDAPDECASTKTCKRCGETDHVNLHQEDEDEWRYEYSDECDLREMWKMWRMGLWRDTTRLESLVCASFRF